MKKKSYLIKLGEKEPENIEVEGYITEYKGIKIGLRKIWSGWVADDIFTGFSLMKDAQLEKLKYGKKALKTKEEALRLAKNNIDEIGIEKVKEKQKEKGNINNQN